MMFQKALTALTTLLLGTAAVYSQEGHPQPAATQEVEILRDPGLEHGVTQGYANHLSPEERADCLSRWKEKGVRDSQWAFWEISEQLYFAHNAETPTLPRPGCFHWSTSHGAKQFQIEEGVVRMKLDTAKEWREGGSLNLPDNAGRAPKYGDPHTVWPHFLIGQHFAKDNEPGTVLAEDEKLGLDRHQRLRFGIDIRLNRLRKSSDWDHQAEYGASNHAIFYMAFILMPRSASRLADSGKFYMLVPAIYSEGNEANVPGSAPWLGLDQFGDGVYFSGAHPTLKAGSWVSYDIDVKQLIREGLAAATQRSLVQKKDRMYRVEDYWLASMLVGWEIWGGFDTDIEFKNMSLRGGPAASQTPANSLRP